MRAFVTGATGFVGSHVARQLAEQGAELRLLTRPTSRIENIADLKAELISGDLADPSSLKRDIKPTPTGRIIVDFLNRKFPAYVDTGLNLVDVREVARAHLTSAEKARPGERYILGGENLTLKAILDKLAAITGLPSPTTKVPHAVALGFAACDQFFTGTLRGKEP